MSTLSDGYGAAPHTASIQPPKHPFFGDLPGPVESAGLIEFSHINRKLTVLPPDRRGPSPILEGNAHSGADARMVLASEILLGVPLVTWHVTGSRVGRALWT